MSNEMLPFSQLDETVKRLLEAAVTAREFAYCPYSNFKVGAAILCTDGTIITGCNVENAAFTVGVCAERTAYCKAISEGKKEFKAVAVVAFQEQFITPPCGACRQFMSEFGDVQIYLAKPQLDGAITTTLRDLLPLSFQINKDYTF